MVATYYKRSRYPFRPDPSLSSRDLTGRLTSAELRGQVRTTYGTCPFALWIRSLTGEVALVLAMQE